MTKRDGVGGFSWMWRHA